MISWLFIGLVITILLTPGPTNTLLASSGIQVGVRKSLRLIPAESIGYLISISVWGLVVGTVSSRFSILPILHQAMNLTKNSRVMQSVFSDIKMAILL